MFGFLNVLKPAGPTSHDVVAMVRRALPRRTKLGHAGTLDPFADGVLVLCAGPATRLADYVQAATKRYRAEITLGAASTTDDTEGEITPAGPCEPPPHERLGAVLSGLVGEIMQTPPAHSAVHVHGRRAYKLARAGQVPELTPRQVRIDAIDLLEYDWPKLTVEVTCGSGTYIRAIARDVGEALSVGGYCSNLTRLAVGCFRIEEAVVPDKLDLRRDLLDPLIALEDMPKVTVSAEETARLANGKAIPFTGGVSTPEVALIDDAGRLLAIASPDAQAGLLRPKKVFPELSGLR